MRYTIAVLIAFCFCACDIDSLLDEEAEFVIISRQTGMTTYDTPTMTLTVKNVGSAPGYNLSCDIQVKKGNTIIGSGWAYFAGGGDIDPGEQAQDEAIFRGLTSLANCELSYKLNWLEY